MLKFIGKWFKIYEDEIRLFMWTFFLFFLLRGSNVILNNYAETAFLKRYGVEYLPIVYMLNSIALFFIMGVMTGIMVKFPGARILSFLFIICGISIALIRFLIPLGIDLIYPALFMLKAQYEALLGLLFWDMANDLFNTRQSKRLFPLITAGGVIGSIVGSFGTPFLARTITMDNILFFYLGTTLTGAVVVTYIGREYPTLLFSGKKNKATKSRGNIIGSFKKIIPMIKESSLVKILILLTFLPNIIIPILNYQFNFAVNAQYATESGLIHFFGYFRGFLNVISLFILLFVGRLYGRWGLPVALMFHPANYVIAFIAFLLKFDVFSAIYARMSTMILRITINNPARNILMGLIPEFSRSILRPFLRGTVVRTGLLIGSGIILISEDFFHPRYLSFVAIPFAVAWLGSVYFLKKSYPNILIGMISKDIFDLRALEEVKTDHLFSGEKIKSRLIRAFFDAKGESALWYARLLKSIGIKNLDQHLLSALKNRENGAIKGLLDLLSGDAGKEAVIILKDIAKIEKNPDIIGAAIKAVNRLDPEFAALFDYEHFLHGYNSEIKGHTLAGLYRRKPEKYGSVIKTLLHSGDQENIKTGIIAVGGSKDVSFENTLSRLLNDKKNEPLLPDLLASLSNLAIPALNDIAQPYLSHRNKNVRLAALDAIEVTNDTVLKRTIQTMGDPREDIYELAKTKIEKASYQNIHILVESLTIPNRIIRKGIFDILERLGVKDLDIFRFARSQIQNAYQYLADAIKLETFSRGDARPLLAEHFKQKMVLMLKNVLHILAVQDSSGQVKVIYKGIFSSDTRKRANAMEAMETVVDIALLKIMMPLFEISSVDESLAAGLRNFTLKGNDENQDAFLFRLLSSEDWVNVALTLDIMLECGLKGGNDNILQKLAGNENRFISRAAGSILSGSFVNDEKGGGMENEMTISDKIMLLKGIDIFKSLSVGELAAIASIVEDMDLPSGEIIIKEGSYGETMYLITKGEVSVIKDLGGPHEIELDRIMPGDYCGEMALIEDIVRSASIRTEKPSSFMVLHKHEFKEIVNEYPKIALEICKVLSQRIRKLHGKIEKGEYCKDLT